MLTSVINTSAIRFFFNLIETLRGFILRYKAFCLYWIFILPFKFVYQLKMFHDEVWRLLVLFLLSLCGWYVFCWKWAFVSLISAGAGVSARRKRTWASWSSDASKAYFYSPQCGFKSTIPNKEQKLYSARISCEYIFPGSWLRSYKDMNLLS